MERTKKHITQIVMRGSRTLLQNIFSTFFVLQKSYCNKKIKKIKIKNSKEEMHLQCIDDTEHYFVKSTFGIHLF